MRRHEGVWEGTYTHLDAEGALEDRHRSRVECRFPGGDIFYRQSVLFAWEDGRQRRDVFDGRVAGGCVVFDTPAFSGESWETPDGSVMLRLDRKDEPGASFTEVIILPAGSDHRARTWHWFKDGRLYRRTLCDERRTAP